MNRVCLLFVEAAFFSQTVLVAIIAYAQAGLVYPVAHPVVAHPVAVSHSSSVVHHPVVARVVHPAPYVHAPIVHHAPLVHAPVVPIVRHAPIFAVHH